MVDTASRPTFEDNLEGKRIISCPSPSPSLRKIFRRSIPRHMMWCNAPGASILAFLGICFHIINNFDQKRIISSPSLPCPHDFITVPFPLPSLASITTLTSSNNSLYKCT